MKNFKKLIKEAHLGNPLNENEYLSNKDSYIKISEPRFNQDPVNPNFLFVRINYDTGPGVGIALGKETMAGQIRRLSSAEALRQMEIIGRKLNDSYDLEDLDINDLENGVVELFAVSDDFIGMDPRSELSMAMLEENQKYDDEDIVIYDGEEHIIMRKDENMVYIRPLEDSAILGKRDEIKVPADELDENEKYDHIARAEYGKPWTLLSIAQKQEMLSYMNRETEKQFQTDYTRRSQGDYSDDMEDGMTDYERQQRSRMDEDINEEFKKGDKVTYLGNPGEITFVGKDQMDRTYYSVAYDKGRGRTKASNLYNKGGEIKAIKEDINDPVLMKARAAQMKRDAMDKKDLENKSKRISADKSIDLRYELSILDREREDILMRIEDLGVETDQTAEPEGGEKADDVGRRMEVAIKDLRDIDSKIIDIKDDLGIFDMNESDLDEGDCGCSGDCRCGENKALDQEVNSMFEISTKNTLRNTLRENLKNRLS